MPLGDDTSNCNLWDLQRQRNSSSHWGFSRKMRHIKKYLLNCCTKYKFSGKVIPSQKQQGIHSIQTPPQYRNAASHASLYGPLRPNMMSSIKPKYITYRNAARAGLSYGHRGYAEQILRRSVHRFQRYACRQTDTHRQTDRQTKWSQYSTPLPGRRKNYCKQINRLESQVGYMCDVECQQKQYRSISPYINQSLSHKPIRVWNELTIL